MRDYEVAISADEIESRKMSSENLEAAKKSLIKNGFVSLNNLFNHSDISDYRVNCLRQLKRWLHRTTHAKAGQYRGIAVGNYRLHHPLELQGVLNSPNLYANFAILEVCKSFIGPFACLGSMALVSSFPGADRQRIHSDTLALYPERFDQTANMLPFSFSVSIPVENINDRVGGTKFIPGSHKYDSIDQFLNLVNNGPVEVVEPLQNLGSCVIWDVRTQHFGTENISTDVVRPIIYFSYQRGWYRDSNVFFHPAFKISKKEYNKIPSEYLSLFEIFRETQGKWRFDSENNIFYPNGVKELERLKLLKDNFQKLDEQLGKR